MQVVRPKRLLYIAIDGVAPRAKMNNQRERRYKFVDEVRIFKQKATQEGQEISEGYFDPNGISPGTTFMLKLNEELQRFIERKMESDKLWQGIEVIFSGVDVPGEGEHKMMQYIREHQEEPNIRHCMYGLDADLIILALATHQPYITILREEVNLSYLREDPRRKLIGETQKYQIILISLLREYLKLDFAELAGLDFERLVDDFVLMVAFVGNDFVPRLPTFEISEGSINFLISSYKKLWSTVGYLTQDGVVQWARLAVFLKDLPQYERSALEDRIKSKKRRRENEPIPADKESLSLKKIYLQGVNSAYRQGRKTTGEETEEDSEEEIAASEEGQDSEAAERLRKRLKGDLKQGGMELIKAKYYQECFGFPSVKGEGEARIREVTREYLRGLQWVLFYYYRGCPDWEWYYPYHYGPMISDFLDVNSLMGIPEGSETPFAHTVPYKPIEQLVSVLPPDSSHLLPEEIRPILTSGLHSAYFPAKPRIEYDFLCAKVGWQSLKIVLPFVHLTLVRELLATIPETDEIRTKNLQNTDVSFTFRQSRIQRTLLPPSTACTFTGRLIPGTFPTHPDFPTLHSIPLSWTLKEIGINVFLSRSTLETLALEVKGDGRPLQAWTGLVGQVRYVQWPSCLPALVVAVSSPEDIYPKNFQFSHIKEQSPSELRDQLDFHLKYVKGIRVQGGPRLVLHVQPLRYISKLVDGSYAYVWENTMWYYPVELTMESMPVGHHVSLPLPQVLRDEFPVGGEVVCSLKAAYGAKGTVVGYGYDHHCPQGSALVSNLVYPISIPEDLISGLYQVEQFLPVRELCRSLQASARVLTRLLGNLKLKYSTSSGAGMYQLGLDLSNYKDQLHVEGWAQWNEQTNGYEYSRNVLPVLQQYKAQFPAFWQRLEQLQGGKIMRVEVLFPNLRNSMTELKRISLFISKQPSARLPWTPDGSVRCGNTQIGILSQYMRTIQRSSSADKYNVNPALMTPSFPCYIKPDYSERLHFDLGSSVINVNSQDLPSIPFAAFGIVVGVYTNDTVEVVFEGNSGGLKVVRTWNLININYPFFVKLRSESAAGDVAEVRAESRGKQVGRGRNTAGRYSVQRSALQTYVGAQTDERLHGRPAEEEKYGQHMRTVSEAVPTPADPTLFQLQPTAPEFVPTASPLTAPEAAAFSSPFS